MQNIYRTYPQMMIFFIRICIGSWIRLDFDSTVLNYAMKLPNFIELLLISIHFDVHLSARLVSASWFLRYYSFRVERINKICWTTSATEWNLKKQSMYHVSYVRVWNLHGKKYASNIGFITVTSEAFLRLLWKQNAS